MHIPYKVKTVLKVLMYSVKETEREGYNGIF